MLSGCTGQPGTQTIGISRLRFPLPAQIIGQTHAACWISLHGMNATVGGAGSCRDDCPGMRRQTVDPLASRNRLSGPRVGSERSPITFALIGFVGDRSFDHENERPCRFSLGRFAEWPHELVSIFVREKWVIEIHLWRPGQRAGHNVFDARLGGAGHRDRVSIAAQSSRQPQDVNFFDHSFIDHCLLTARIAASPDVCVRILSRFRWLMGEHSAYATRLIAPESFEAGSPVEACFRGS